MSKSAFSQKALLSQYNTYIIAIVLQFLIDWLKRKFWFFFSITPVFGTHVWHYVWRALLVHIADASLSAWFPPRRHGKILSKRKQPFLYTRRYSCNIIALIQYFCLFFSTYYGKSISTIHNKLIFCSFLTSVWCYFYTSPVLQSYKYQ